MTSLKDFFSKTEEKMSLKVAQMNLMTVFSFWCVRSHEHTPAHAPLAWCVQKVARATSAYDTYCLGRWNKKKWNKDQKHQIE